MSWKLYERAPELEPESNLNMELGAAFSLFDNWERDDPKVAAVPGVPTAAAASAVPPPAPLSAPLPPNPSEPQASSVDNMMLFVQAVQRGSAAPTDDKSGGTARREPGALYTCTVPNCNKHFTQQAHLDTHYRSHTGERPYPCTYDSCQKAFSQLGNLKTHMRLHTGEKPFVCPVCNKGFGQRGNLTQHKAIHNKERTFKCELDDCKKTFAQLGNLKTHQNTNHKETLARFTAQLQGGGPQNLSPQEMRMFEYFVELYKNSNRGIKGRGRGNKVEKLRPPAPIPRIHNLPLPPPNYPEWREDSVPAWKP